VNLVHNFLSLQISPRNALDLSGNCQNRGGIVALPTMKTTLTFLLSLLIFTSVKSQHYDVDSLKRALISQSQDSNNVNTLNHLSWSLILENNYSSSEEYAIKAQELSERIGYKKGLAQAFNNIGAIKVYQGNYSNALNFYMKGLKVSEEIGDKKEIVMCLMNIGHVYASEADDSKALEYYMKALAIIQELGDEHKLSSVYMNIGAIYLDQHAYDKALEYCKKAKDEAEKINNQELKASASLNIGMIYNQMGESGEATSSFNEALSDYQAMGDKEGEARTEIQIGNSYFSSGNTLGAISWHQKAEVIANQINDMNAIRDISEALSKEYERTGKYQDALKYQIRFKMVSDSLLNQERTQSMVEMEMKYEEAKKENQIKNLEAENDRRSMSMMRGQRSIILFVILGIVLVVGFIIYLIITQMRIRDLRLTIRQMHGNQQYSNNPAPTSNPDLTKGPPNWNG
jgi:tetratricopeptide (TPR) repeat protein